GHADEGERLAREVLAGRQKAEGEKSDGVQNALIVLGICLREEKKLDAAEQSFQRALDQVREDLPLSHPVLIRYALYVSEVQEMRDRYDRVIETLLPSAEAVLKTSGDSMRDRRCEMLMQSLEEAYQKTNQPARAKALHERVAALQATTAPSSGPSTQA